MKNHNKEKSQPFNLNLMEGYVMIQNLNNKKQTGQREKRNQDKMRKNEQNNFNKIKKYQKKQFDIGVNIVNGNYPFYRS